MVIRRLSGTSESCTRVAPIAVELDQMMDVDKIVYLFGMDELTTTLGALEETVERCEQALMRQRSSTSSAC